jgi:hypothetical protein
VALRTFLSLWQRPPRVAMLPETPLAFWLKGGIDGGGACHNDPVAHVARVLAA